MLLNPGRPYSLGKLGKLKVNSIIKNINQSTFMNIVRISCILVSNAFAH